MSIYLATKAGGSFRRNDQTIGLMRVPDLRWLLGAAREVRRVDLAGGKRHFNRATVEYAYRISLDQLNEREERRRNG